MGWSDHKPKKVPELSLSQYIEGQALDRQDFIAQLFAGIQYFGFIILKDHPICSDLLKKAYQLSQEFFELPTEIKNKYVSAAGGGQRGYTPFGREHARDTPVPDLKEFWHVGRELSQGHPLHLVYPENLWPSEVEGFKETFLNIYQSLDDVGQVLLEALTEPLQVPSDYFKGLTQDGNSILRMLHYPPIPEGTDPRCVRAAAHEDINLITLLVSASASGLELLDREGQWLPVETDPENLIVDAGDMLSRITNEVIPATTHRVVNPEDGNKDRYSMPFFMHPHPNAQLSCIESCVGEGAKYSDITAQDFLMQRLREIGLMS